MCENNFVGLCLLLHFIYHNFFHYNPQTNKISFTNYLNFQQQKKSLGASEMGKFHLEYPPVKIDFLCHGRVVMMKIR